MKNFKNIIPILGLTLVVASCDYNEKYFPGYDDGVAPTNVFAYEDSLVSADYTTISKVGLAGATNSADSVLVKSLATLKYFPVDIPASKYIPFWIANKYMYGDIGSSVTVISSQYLAEEGGVEDVKEKYILGENGWEIFDPKIFLEESFLTDWGDFTAVSLEGEQEWKWSSYNQDGFAKISGYVSSSKANYDNEDWLISPAMDFSGYDKINLTFDHVSRYGVNMNIELTLWATDNYTVGGTIDTTKWKELKFEYAYNASSYTFKSSGPVSLDYFANKQNVRIGFRYKSFATSSAATWEIKNVLVMEAQE